MFLMSLAKYSFPGFNFSRISGIKNANPNWKNITEMVRTNWYLLCRYFKINLYPKPNIATVYNVPYTNH